MLDQIKAAIFDLDGTLVDSMWMWKAIDIEFLKQHGLDCPPDLQKAIEGMGFSETALYFKNRFHLPESIDEIKRVWTAMVLDQYRHEVPLKKGALEFMQVLRTHGIKMGIATSNGREIVDTVIEALNIGQYFDVIVTACEVKAGKPSPDIYLEAALRLGMKPKHCMVFEDIPAGILAGKRAGMRVYAVDDVYSRHMKEEKCRLADYYIDDYYDLLNGVIT